MDINKLKKDYKKMRIPKMDVTINDTINMENFIQKIKNQDKEDERYLLHNQIIPLIVGLFIIVILMIINPIKTVLMVTGLFMIFCALMYALILRVVDYKNISKESHDVSLFSYLKQKEVRLDSWRMTPNKYKWIFTIFVSGLVFMVIGNTAMMRDFGPERITIYIIIYIILFITAWIVGEHFYRKRHKKKHQPLINNIRDLINELGEEKK